MTCHICVFCSTACIMVDHLCNEQTHDRARELPVAEVLDDAGACSP